MNRFSSLEFEDSGDKDSRKRSGEPIRNVEFFLRRAEQSFLNGDFEVTLRNYSRALEQNSSLLAAWAGQIRMLIELGEYPEALVWGDKALELFPDHPEITALQATACVRDAQFEKALKLSDFSVSRENAGSRVWLARGEVMMKRKSRVAETCVSKAISLAGTSVDLVRLEAGRILLRYGSYNTALENLSQAVRAFPKSALAWYEYGRCQRRMGFPEARVSFEQSLQIRPEWDAAQRGLERSSGSRLLPRFVRRLFVR